MGDALLQFQGTIYEKGYGQVSKMVMQDPALTQTAKLLYAYLCTYGTGAFPSRDKICHDLKITKNRISVNMSNLVKNGYITITRIRESGKFTHSIYNINFVKDGNTKK